MNTSKGFAFTIDAMFAISIVIILAAAYANIYLVEKADVEAAKSVRQQAIDEALVSFYTNGSPSLPVISGTAKYHYCTKLLDYDFSTPVAVKDTYCWEVS